MLNGLFPTCPIDYRIAASALFPVRPDDNMDRCLFEQRKKSAEIVNYEVFAVFLLPHLCARSA